jgi:hypothetical protein
VPEGRVTHTGKPESNQDFMTVILAGWAASPAFLRFRVSNTSKVFCDAVLKRPGFRHILLRFQPIKSKSYGGLTGLLFLHNYHF